MLPAPSFVSPLCPCCHHHTSPSTSSPKCITADPLVQRLQIYLIAKNVFSSSPLKTTSSSPSLMLNAIVVRSPLPTFPVVVRRPISHAIVVRCCRPPPSSAAITVVVRRCCLSLPPSLPQLSLPLRCLRHCSPPALILPRHSPLPDLASHHHLPLSSSATVVVVRRRRRCPPPRSSSVAAIIATQLSPASLATVVPSPS